MSDDRTLYDAGCPEAVEDALSDLSVDQPMEDLRCIMNTPEGRRVLARLLIATGPLSSGYCADSGSNTAFRQGVRWVGQWLLREAMQADPEGATKILTAYAKTTGVLDG